MNLRRGEPSCLAFVGRSGRVPRPDRLHGAWPHVHGSAASFSACAAFARSFRARFSSCMAKARSIASSFACSRGSIFSVVGGAVADSVGGEASSRRRLASRNSSGNSLGITACDVATASSSAASNAQSSEWASQFEELATEDALIAALGVAESRDG